MKRIIAALLALVLMAGFAACGKAENPAETTAEHTTPTQATLENELGEGPVTFRLAVTNPKADPSYKEFTIHTEKMNIGDALLEVGLVSGDESKQFGLMVKTVDGTTADYAKDKAWWKFTVNMVDAPQGVSQTPIEPQKMYGFEYTVD